MQAAVLTVRTNRTRKSNKSIFKLKLLPLKGATGKCAARGKRGLAIKGKSHSQHQCMQGTPGNAGHLPIACTAHPMQLHQNKTTNLQLPLGVSHESLIAKGLLVVELERPHLQLLGDELTALQIVEGGGADDPS